MENGFYPALGTPVDIKGKLIKDSFEKQIESMIDAGASGVLCMGSMGNMTSIKGLEYKKIAEACVETTARRCPVMVGVMDCSVARVLDRIYALRCLDLEGVVATPPFYYKSNTTQIINFYKMVAKESKYPVFIYDLPVVTQSPVEERALLELINTDNIAGIKTANIALITKLMREGAIKEDFQVLFSDLDIFDVAIGYGIKKILDGMFTCTPVNSKRMYECASGGDKDGVSYYLRNIIKLRDEFIKSSIFTAYSYAMELLGMPGYYQPDYHGRILEEAKDGIYNCMKEIGEL